MRLVGPFQPTFSMLLWFWKGLKHLCFRATANLCLQGPTGHFPGACLFLSRPLRGFCALLPMTLLVAATLGGRTLVRMSSRYDPARGCHILGHYQQTGTGERCSTQKPGDSTRKGVTFLLQMLNSSPAHANTQQCPAALDSRSHGLPLSPLTLIARFVGSEAKGAGLLLSLDLL